MVAFGTEELKLDKYQRMAYKVKPSIVKVVAVVEGKVTYQVPQQQQGEGAATTKTVALKVGGGGSGFIVHPSGYVITNGHVVKTINDFNTKKELVIKDILNTFLQTAASKLNMPFNEKTAAQLYQQFKPQVSATDLEPTSIVILSNNKRFPFEIKQYSQAITAAVMEGASQGKDIAILKIEGKNLPTVKLGDSDKVKLQELVFAFGFPDAAETLFTDIKSDLTEVSINRGTVSALKADYRGVPIIQSDVNISWGNSGGPSTNENGEVIGMNSYGGIAKGQAIGGFAFLVPVNTLKEFVNAAGVKDEKSLFNEIYYQALEKIWAGEWFEGRDFLNKALVFIPEQPDILKLRMDVETVISRMGWFARNWQRNSIAMVSLGIIALLIIGVGVTFVVRKTPQKAAQPAAQPVRQPRPMEVAPEGETRVEGKFFGTLTLSIGGQMGKSYPIGEKGVVIGREPSQCDIVISDANVSRVHAWITIEKNEAVVIDRGSTNGTFVNNNKVEKAKLKSGDVIQLGQKCPTTLIFKQ